MQESVARTARRMPIVMIALALSLGACTPSSGPPVNASTLAPDSTAAMVQGTAPAPSPPIPQQGTVVHPSAPGYAYFPPFRSDDYPPVGPAFGFGLGPRPGIGYPFGW
jgi:hypothetical protein